jgi:hypothetical protein
MTNFVGKCPHFLTNFIEKCPHFLTKRLVSLMKRAETGKESPEA